MKLDISTDLVKTLIKTGGIIDGQKGGLILGDCHEKGGINLVQITNSFSMYLIANVEGYEFLMNNYAVRQYKKRLHEINNELNGLVREFDLYFPPKNIISINCERIISNIQETSKYLCTYGIQMIINRHSSKKYLNELNDMNIKAWEEFHIK